MKHFFHVFACCCMLLGACGVTSAAQELVVMTHDSFSMSKEVLASFEKTNDVTVRILKSGDAGAALNQAILSKNSPLADVFYGVDNTFLSRAVAAGIFEPYAPAELSTVPTDLNIDRTGALIPVDFGDVCLNYDIAWFESKKINPPSSLEDLIKPEYKDLTVVQNPATSSPGLAFLLATMSHFGEKDAWSYWKKLKENGVLITAGWKEAYWGEFSAASKGKRPIVVSYATSPAAEVHFSKKPISTPPTAAVLSAGCAFRQIEFAGILKGTTKSALARKFVDFLLSARFQEDIPLQMFVFPANKQAALPEIFQKHTRTASAPAVIAPETIESKRDTWINAWTQLMLN